MRVKLQENDDSFTIHLTQTGKPGSDLVATIPLYRDGYARQFVKAVCKHVDTGYYWYVCSWDESYNRKEYI